MTDEGYKKLKDDGMKMHKMGSVSRWRGK